MAERSSGEPRDGRTVEGPKFDAPNAPPPYESGSSKAFDDVVNSDASLPN